ncbi:MAG: hypothetical protein HC866_18000 [Leptolyngbyaceae cyanobacterium RU_5_1]|nr:hypothetical protein [Leptolyngbyaceae cyanobacterium RU_5_1]
MLHLARVEKKGLAGETGLRLLARQRSEYVWTVLLEPDFLAFEGVSDYGEGLFVLAELSETQEILEIKDAKDWVLSILQTFLVSGITPGFLQQESERAEHWRQSLTLQSQDLDRRALELEARREQLEQLEESLKREKKQMESLAAQYKDQSQELDRRTSELEARREQVEQLEAALKVERTQLEETAASVLDED